VCGFVAPTADGSIDRAVPDSCLMDLCILASGSLQAMLLFSVALRGTAAAISRRAESCRCESYPPGQLAESYYVYRRTCGASQADLTRPLSSSSVTSLSVGRLADYDVCSYTHTPRVKVRPVYDVTRSYFQHRLITLYKTRMTFGPRHNCLIFTARRCVSARYTYTLAPMSVRTSVATSQDGCNQRCSTLSGNFVNIQPGRRIHVLK